MLRHLPPDRPIADDPPQPATSIAHNRTPPRPAPPRPTTPAGYWTIRTAWRHRPPTNGRRRPAGHRTDNASRRPDDPHRTTTSIAHKRATPGGRTPDEGAQPDTGRSAPHDDINRPQTGAARPARPPTTTPTGYWTIRTAWRHRPSTNGVGVGGHRILDDPNRTTTSTVHNRRCRSAGHRILDELRRRATRDVQKPGGRRQDRASGSAAGAVGRGAQDEALVALLEADRPELVGHR